jgi:hypothetical protein
MDSFIERIDWVVDLLSNFRGMSWNWRIRSLPSPPKDVQRLLNGSDDDESKKQNPRSRPAFQPPSRRGLIKDTVRKFFIGYLCLDFIRTITIHDPYFRGLGTTHKPKYIPLQIQESPTLLQVSRLLVALFAVYWALATIFLLAPLFFSCILGSKLIGVRGEPWMYPPEWGNFKAVLDRGLAGWWGIWWHQTFRFAFEAPSKRLVGILKIDRRSLMGKILQLFIAFALSGSIHAAGSHTSIGDTRPIRGPFMFFILQPIGIMGQTLLAKALQNMGISNRMPIVVQQATNFVVVHIWLYYTAPLLIDDLAKGGTFLFEPIPFSISRLLGLGGRHESCICWDLSWVRWHTGLSWLESGLST